jgi:hypothetical protein
LSPANDAAGQLQESFIYESEALEADAPSSEVVKPGNGAFCDPEGFTQTKTRLEIESDRSIEGRFVTNVSAGMNSILAMANGTSMLPCRVRTVGMTPSMSNTLERRSVQRAIGSPSCAVKSARLSNALCLNAVLVHSPLADRP